MPGDRCWVLSELALACFSFGLYISKTRQQWRVLLVKSVFPGGLWSIDLLKFLITRNKIIKILLLFHSEKLKLRKFLTLVHVILHILK
jgi:hypothetical protein